MEEGMMRMNPKMTSSLLLVPLSMSNPSSLVFTDIMNGMGKEEEEEETRGEMEDLRTLEVHHMFHKGKE
jgi:hypothetical protein